jgi:ABC-type Mn2+/Zn2+ transport system ATPase subunit
MDFADTWKHVMTEEFYDKPIAKLSGGKKKIPLLVSTLMEMREMIKRVILFVVI